MMYRVSFIIVAILMIFALSILTLRFTLPNLNEYKGVVATHLSEVIGVGVKIGAMQVKLSGIEPVVDLSQVEIEVFDGVKNSLHIGQLHVEFDLIKSLFSGSIKISDLHIWDTDFLINTDIDGNSKIFGVLPINFLTQEASGELSDTKFHLGRANIHWRNEQVGADYKFDHVSAVLAFQNRRLQVAIKMLLPPALGQDVQLIADLQDVDWFGNVDQDDSHWSGQVYLRADGVDVVQWARLTGQAGMTSGKLTTELWSNWYNGALQGLDGAVSCEVCTVVLDKANPQAMSLKTRLSWEALAEGWRLGMLDLNWVDLDSGLSLRHGDVAVDYHEGDSRLVLRTPTLDQGLLRMLADVAGQFQGKGVEIDNGYGAIILSATVAHPNFDPPTQQSTLENSPAPDWKRLFDEKFNFISKYASKYADYLISSSSLKLAKAEIDLQDVSVKIPDWSDQLFNLDTISSIVRYDANDSMTSVHIDKLSARFGDAQLSGQFAWLDGEEPLINAELSIATFPLTAVKELLPKTGMNPALRQWLDQAFVEGVIKTANVALDGAMSSFPFNDGGGQFHAEGDIKAAVLNYRRNRKPLQDVDAHFVFDNQSITIEASRLRYYDLMSQSARIVLKDFKLPFVEVDAVGEGDVSSVLSYLKDAQLLNLDSALIDLFEISGDSRLNLSVKAPLSKKINKPVTVEGTLNFKNNDLWIAPLGLQFSDITGLLNFDRNGGNAQLLTANLNGGLVSGEAKPKQGATLLTLKGDFAIDQLLNLSAIPLKGAVQGVAPWQAELLIPNLREQSDYDLTMSLTSSLKGIEVTLPDPFGKPASQRRDLKVDISLGKLNKYSVSYGDEIKAMLFKSGQVLAPWGYLHFGEDTPPLIEKDVFIVNGKLNQAIDLNDWVGLIAGGSSHLNFDHVDLSFVELRRGDEVLGEASVTMVSKDSGYELQIDAPWAQGWIFVPDTDDGVVFAKMSKLFLPKQASTDTSVVLDPRSVPPLEVEISDFKRGDLNVFNLRVLTTPFDKGMQIGRIDFEAGEVLMSMHGQWLFDGNAHRSQFFFEANGNNYGKTLRRLAISKDFRGGDGSLAGEVAWDGAPTEFALVKLEGEVNVELTDGVIKKAEPGMSRLFGLLSVGHIVKRLSFDFRDVIEKGLRFDTLKGDLRFNDSIMHTDNLMVVGPALKMTIRGDNKIAQKQYDQWIDVVPNLSSSLPVASALLAGPIAGVAVYLIDKFTDLGSKVDKAATLRYHLYGSWDNPQIDFESVPEAEKGAGKIKQIINKVIR